MGDPVLAMRIRDGLATLAYLRTRKEIDPGKIVVGGHGMGGVVAMHVAAIYAAMDAHAPHLAGVFEIDAPATFESFAATQEYAWSPEDFFPSVLRYYDLPQLARSLKVPALIINPLGAAKEAIGQQTASELYNPGGGLEIRTGLDSAAIPAALGAFVSSIRDK
jgi:pimeloyl-ACP methyl ester carboxylesterase